MIQATSVKRTTVTSNAPKSRVEIPIAQKPLAKVDLQKIQEKAYELYVQRGCQNGYDVEDWLQAERIIKGAKI